LTKMRQRDRRDTQLSHQETEYPN